MVLKLYDTDISNMIMEKEYPEIFSVQEGGIEERSVCIDLPYGKARYKEIYFEGVHIGYGDANLSASVILNFESDFETIEMHFSLKGSSSSITDQFKKGFNFSGNQHNIIYANCLKGEMLWSSEDFQLLEINLSPRFFTKYLPDNSHFFNRFREIIRNGDSGVLSKTNHLISLQMYQVIRDILQCNRKGIFKRMFLEAKVIELLLLQLEQMNTGENSITSLKKADVDKIYAVREFIVSNMNKSYSLIDLAHRVGTNEFALKKGFKELFGTTVFGFWHDVKMEQARKLLVDDNMNVGEVSDAVGYQNPRHFSSAFKKKFGVLPRQVRR